MKDVVVTIPKHFDRVHVMRQLRRCAGVGRCWHYCTNRLPRERPDRMHFVHDGEVIGSMPVFDMGEFEPATLTRPDGSPMFTARRFAIRASGAFFEQSPPIRMKGFRGWRYFDGCPACGGLGVVFDKRGDDQPCADCCATAEAAQ